MCCSACHDGDGDQWSSPAYQLIDISSASMFSPAEGSKPGMLNEFANDRTDSMLDIFAVVIKV